MKLRHKKLSREVRRAFVLGAAASAGLAGTAVAQTATTAQADQGTPSQTKTLQTIVVTGSHISRAELETSNPVTVVTAEQIAKTGQLTLGSIIKRLPQITGSAHTPNLDFGGNTGATFIGLRGLGANRTLVLIDGQRVQGETNQNIDGAVDLDSIPAAAVERIEVLTDGASAIYGSDAIGGVINIILKSQYQGERLSANYGISSHGDGVTKGASFLFGHTFDKGSIVGAVSYNKFQPVAGARRKFSRDMLSLTTTSAGAVKQVQGGATLAGPLLNLAVPPDVAAAFGCDNPDLGLALKNSSWKAENSPTTNSDYRCFAPTDNYNMNAVLDLVTPQERKNAYIKGTFKLTDHISAFLTAIYDRTQSSANVPPTPYATWSVPGVAISADSYYNPFGEDFSTSGSAQYSVMFHPLGIVVDQGTTTVNYIMGGLKGDNTFIGHDWKWDVGFNYSHISLVVQEMNLVNNKKLAEGAGPSFLNADNTVQCGTPDNPISLSDCTPWDPFNTNAPSTLAVLRDPALAGLTARNNVFSLARLYYADASGGILDLPAGTAELAAGISYREVYQGGQNDAGLLIDPDTGTCMIGSSCTGPAVHGGFNVKEAYGELFVPLLKDAPLVHSLNITLGDRYSKYSDFGSTNNWKIGLEYRPITDLLLRGTVSTVFRAPTVQDVFGNPFVNGNALNADPCQFMAPTPASPNPNAGNAACMGVPAQGTFINDAVRDHTGVNALTSGSKFANFDLKPETGRSYDFGAVYSPSFIPGFSVTVDYWRIYLDNLINASTPETELSLCFLGDSAFCPLIHRVQSGLSAGQIVNILTPVVNLGRLDVKGVDFSLRYQLPETRFGQFGVTVNGTYLTQFKAQTAPGDPSNVVSNGAGLMAVGGTPIGSACPGEIVNGSCYFPRIRGQAAIDWSLGNWSAQWRTQYLGRFRVSGTTGDLKGIDRYGATLYHDVTVGYDFSTIKTSVNVGVNNVFDKQPPILFMNRVPQLNVDSNDFDVLGRFYWASVKVSF